MSIRENITAVKERIAQARQRAGGQEVTLIAVSKTYGPDAVLEAIAAGLTVFGENRVQELLPKMQTVGQAEAVSWRLIGHLQKNKINRIAGVVGHVDSIDSLSTAEKLNKRLLALNSRCRILVEINTSGEASKNGITPEELPAFAAGIAKLSALQPEGLLTIGPLAGSEADNRRAFARLRELRDTIQKNHPEYQKLSMGMSGDFEEAIEEGATMVRVGSLIFGQRI